MPFLTTDNLTALANWLYGFLLYGVGAFTILVIIALLAGQELARAYRGATDQDVGESVVNVTVILPLVVAFLIFVAVQILRIMHWL